MTLYWQLGIRAIEGQTVQRGHINGTNRGKFKMSELYPGEIWWRDHQPWLLGIGYRLRPRYHPNWVPSWLATGGHWLMSEDGQTTSTPALNDAFSVQDNRTVVLKQLNKEDVSQELHVATYFSQKELAADPRNHCVPILRVLDVPDSHYSILIMPLLRPFSDPPFRTVGEVIQCIREILEGVQFMHQHRVAHRDCTSMNIMMDASAMYPSGFHPVDHHMKPDYSGRAKYSTRTECPPKYYLIDFGLSRHFLPEEETLDYAYHGGDKTAPEYQGEGWRDRLVNPFPIDVYYVGNWMRIHFLEGEPQWELRKYFGLHGLEFMEPLVRDMVQDDPSKRPTMDEVMSRFNDIQSSLSPWKLRSRVFSKKPCNPLKNWLHAVKHWFWTLFVVLKRLPPIPTPKS